MKAILEYCRKADAKNATRQHASWCELETGLWHTCDCYLGWHRDDLDNLLWQIKYNKGQQINKSTWNQD